MPDTYDAISTLSVGSAFVLCAIATPVVTPQYFSREDLAFSWALYLAQCATLGCAFLLTCLPARARYRLSVYRATILLVVWSIYAYRDILPLAISGRKPEDDGEGNILWAKIGLLTFAAIVLPIISPRHPRVLTPEGNPGPEQTASILSLVTYTWLNPLIDNAQKQPHLPVEDMPPLAEYNRIGYLMETGCERADLMNVVTNRERGQNALAWALVRLFRRDLATMASMVILASASAFLVPLGLKHILSYVERGPEDEVVRSWVWLVALLVGSMAVSMSMQFYHYTSTQVVARTQAIVTRLMFGHSLRMRSRADTSRSAVETASGKSTSRGSAVSTKGGMPAINNLVTVDLSNVTDSSTFVLLILLETPIQIILSVYFLYSILGWSTFVGVAVMIALFPVPAQLSKRTKGYQGDKARKTDKRVSLVVQLLETIRTAKLLGWERAHAEKLDGARKEELECARKVIVMQIFIGCINVCIPLLIMLSSYATFTFAMNRDLSASIVFSSISLFEILRNQLNLIFFRVPILTNGKVSLDRITRFLRETELLDEFTAGSSSSPALDNRGIEIKNSAFTWTRNPTTGDERTFTLTVPGTLSVKQGGLTVIHGPTACGKTALLMALLGEMHHEPLDSADSYVSLPRAGGVAYSAQEPWILSDTVKENVLFGSDLDRARFDQVISAVAFDVDIEHLPDGEDTVVGERGVKLSGGQKARLSLARAIYSSAQIILLDDVLSALDNTTVRHVTEFCFHTELLHGRTVVLVTNNLNAVLPYAAWEIELDHNGKVINNGNPPACGSELGSNDSEYSADTLDVSDALGKKLTVPEGLRQVAAPEEKAEGHVGWKPLTLLFGNMSSHPVAFWICFLASLFVASIVLNAQVYLLGVWADQYAVESREPEASMWRYLVAYAGLIVLAMITDVAAHYMHLWGSLRASAVIHRKLMDALLGTTLRWLDSTPSSRIVSRCTADIGSVDGQISTFLLKLLELSTSMLVRLVLVAIIAPVFTIGVGLVALVGGLVARRYMKAQLPVKREQSNMRSPLLDTLNTTIAGLVSVRAYNANYRFIMQMHESIDHWTRASNTFFNLNRWVIVRADMIGTMFTVSLACYLSYGTSLNASSIGFSLNMAIAFSSKVFEWVRTLNTFEVAGNSLERIQQYLIIDQEINQQPVDKNAVVDKDWPRTGDLIIENLRAFYSLDGVEIIKGISFVIRSGERVGIVGRTGSGKSTLLLALLRFLYTNVNPHMAGTDATSSSPSGGKILLSGEPITSVDLNTLRQKITIIPQTPELFAGTVWQNLDPFEKHSEGDLRRALLSAQGLNPDDDELPKEGLTLETQVSSGGVNLSAGQRQVIALARAIVRKSRILFMDEATSSIDYKSDEMIQEALRNQLDKDITVLTVAHRLLTIKDYDKVIVLDNGKIVEFDTLSALLQKDNGALRKLAEDGPEEDMKILFKAAGLIPPPSPSPNLH